MRCCRKVFQFGRECSEQSMVWNSTDYLFFTHSLARRSYTPMPMPPPDTSTQNFYHIHIWCLERGSIFHLHFLHTNMWISGQFVLKPIIGIHFWCVRQTRMCRIHTYKCVYFEFVDLYNQKWWLKCDEKPNKSFVVHSIPKQIGVANLANRPRIENTKMTLISRVNTPPSHAHTNTLLNLRRQSKKLNKL